MPHSIAKHQVLIFAAVRIAVNTRFLLKGKLEGFGWYSYETLSRITRQHPEHQFIFFFDRPYDERFVFSDNVEPVVLRPPARHPVLFYLFFERAIPRALHKYKADVFVSPDGYLTTRTEIPQLAVIHDLNFEHHPEDLRPRDARYLLKWFPRFARKADRIVTVSDYSKQDIVAQYQVDPHKIDVCWNGAADLFHPIAEAEQEQVRQELTDGVPYFVYVGALHPRKNIGRLLKAFDQFRKQGHRAKLVIVGEKMWSDAELETTWAQLEAKNEVVFTGRLSPEKLNATLASALALTYLSYFEGFGIPIAEAFKTETPVLSGNLTSLPEVAGDAALLVDPYSIAAITEGMTRLFNDAELRQDLIAKGKQRADLFDWQQSADGLWAAIEKLL